MFVVVTYRNKLAVVGLPPERRTMTNQEAIDILTVYNLEEAENGNEEICEALDMAIKSLRRTANEQ